MTARTLDKKRLQNLRADLLESWLRRTGWTREYHDPAKFSQYIKHRDPPATDGEPEVVDVLHRETPDYALCMRTALGVLELVEGRPAEAILDDIEAPPGDRTAASLSRLREVLLDREDTSDAVEIVDRLQQLIEHVSPLAPAMATSLIEEVCRVVGAVHSDGGLSTSRVVLEALRHLGVVLDADDSVPPLAGAFREARTWLDDLERLVSHGKAPETPAADARQLRLARAVERFVAMLLMADAARPRPEGTVSGLSRADEDAFDAWFDEQHDRVYLDGDDDDPGRGMSEVLRALDPAAYRERALEYIASRGRSGRPSRNDEGVGDDP